jgi:hypothetical protein
MISCTAGSAVGDTLLHCALSYAMDTGSLEWFGRFIKAGARATVFNAAMLSPLLRLLRCAAGGHGELQPVVEEALSLVLGAWSKQVCLAGAC